MRILSYNIRGGLGMDGRRDTARIAEFVHALACDIVCFQEVHQRLPWSGWIDQPRLLGAPLKMKFVFQRCVHLPWGGYGLGIATHLPIRRVVRHRLRSRTEPRGALQVDIGTPHGLLSVFCTHLGLDAGERVAQLGQLGAWVRASPYPAIVCGDINMVPETDALQAFLQETGLGDCGQAENKPTYPSDKPGARIDVLLHAAQWQAADVFTRPSLLSDHLPLIADFCYEDGGGGEECAG